MPPQLPLPEVPRVDDAGLFDYLTRLHAAVLPLISAAQPPNLPTNLTVTPIAGGNVIQFTRSNGVSFNLYLSDSPDRAKATQQNLGSGNSWTDNVGVGGVKRYYWVEALNQQGASSGVVGVKSGTTLALGATATVPFVRPAAVEVFDTTINRTRPDIATPGSPVAQPQVESE